MKSNNNQNEEILICGAGPAGMLLALILKKFQIRPVIIDKLKTRNLHSKAGTIQPRTLEILDDIGLIDDFLKFGVVIPKNNFYDGSKKLGTLEYKYLPSRYNHLLAIPQYETERILEDALNQEGIFVQRGIECTDVEFANDVNKVTLKDLETGETFSLSTRFLIAADGGKSAIRQQLIESHEITLLKQRRYKTNFIMGDFKIKDYPYSRFERSTHFAKRNILAFVPMPGDVVRAIVLQQKQTDQNIPPDIEEFEQLLGNLLGKKYTLSSGDWMGRFYPARFMIDKFRHQNIFFIGDAAHIISPISGQGINLAFEEAYNLGWKLAKTVQGKIKSTVLDTYSKERAKVVERIFDHSDKNQRMVSSYLGNFLLRKLIKLGMKTQKEKMKIINELTLFDANYAVQNGKKESKGLREGSRLENTVLSQQNGKKKRLFDFLRYGKFSIIVNHYSEDSERVPEKKINELNDLIDGHDILVLGKNDIDLENGSSLKESLKCSSPYLIIRPDKFVMFLFHDETFEIMKQNFNQYIEFNVPVLA